MLYNIVIIGDYYVGKSSIVQRIINDTFELVTYSTIGTSYFSKEIYIDNINKTIKFSLWDTAGQERFRSFVSFYIKKAHIIYLCYDITNRDSFNNLTLWLNIIKKIIKINFIGFIIGTKSDLKDKRVISAKEGQNYADKINFFFYETSSKLNDNIDTLLDFTIDTFVKKNIKEIINDEKKENIINIKNNKFNYLQYC